jgi:hypothetical protein
MVAPERERLHFAFNRAVQLDFYVAHFGETQAVIVQKLQKARKARSTRL